MQFLVPIFQTARKSLLEVHIPLAILRIYINNSGQMLPKLLPGVAKRLNEVLLHDSHVQIFVYVMLPCAYITYLEIY